MKVKICSFIIILSLLVSSLAGAHSGNTDQSGCHNDNIHGGRHCHNSGDDDSSSDNSTVLIVVGVLAAGLIIWMIAKSSQKNKLGLLPYENENIDTSPLSLKFIPNIKDGQPEGIIQLSYSF